MVAGHALSGGRAASRAFSTRPRSRSPSAAPGSGRGVVIVGTRQRLRPRLPLGVEHDVPARVLDQHLDPALRLLELAVAEAREADALLVELQRLFEGEVALLQLLHDLLELLQGLLESRGFRGQEGSFPVTVAASVPSCRRTRRSSPTATSLAARTRRRPEASHTSA